MRVSFTNKQRHVAWQKKLLLFLLPFFIVTVSVSTLLATTSSTVLAATSNTLNFQGRLLSSTGGLVADGSYNIEFNLYTVASAGTSEWTETRLNSGAEGVTVQNGYFSVYLGDVTAFPTTVNWDQEHWLGMTIRGTGSCAFGACTPTDAEMTPRFKLTAVPYAFSAGAVLDSAGNAYTGDDLVQAAPSTIQTVNVAIAALRLNQTGTGGLVQLQGDSGDVFTVDKTGATTLGAGITVGNSTLTTAGTIRWSGSDLEVYDGSEWVSLTSGSGGSITIDSNIKAYGKVQGSTGTALNISGATVVRNSAGNYTVTLSSSLSTANYTILATPVDSATDDANIAITAQTTSSFTVNIGRGDNGTITDVATDKDWHFVVIDDASGGSSGVYVQDGNSFGETAILGTTDAFGLDIITNGTAALSISSAGAATFENGLTISSGGLNLTGDITGTTDLTVSSGGSGDLILDSDSDVLVLSDNTLRRSGSGSTYFDLLDSSADTTFEITNSDLSRVADLSVEGAVSATSFSGNGSGLTALNGSNVTSGTIADTYLSSNVALLDTAQTYTSLSTFNAGLVVGNTTNTDAGTLRWTGLDLEVYDGSAWVSLTSSTSSDTPATATFYDSTGGATIASGTFSTVNLDTTLSNSDSAVVDVLNDVVTVTEDGYYQIDYHVTSTLGGGTRSGFNTKLQLDTGTGYNDVSGSEAYHYGRLTSETQGTSSASVVLSLSEDDSIRIQAQGTSQSFTTVANATNLTITKIVAAGSSGGGGSNSFTQNGNSFSSTAILGTTDAYGLNIVTNGSTALSFTSAGAASFVNGLTISSGGLGITGDITGTTDLTLASGGTGNLTLDSASDVLILSDSTLRRSSSGTTTVDLLDTGGSDTTFAITNSDGTGVADLTVEGTITASNYSGDGSGISSLSGTNITSGTLSDLILSSNVALLNTAQTFTAIPTFNSGAILGNSTSTTAGAIRWSGTDFEGFDGIQWVSLTVDNSASLPLLEGVLAFGKVDSTGSALDIDGATVVRNSTGSYTVTLDTSASSADYVVQLTAEEDGTARDDINITIDNQATTGFDVTIREGDNSTTADVLRDRDWHFIAFDPDASAGGGGGGGTSFNQSGNSFSATGVLGTTDAFGLSIITNSSLALSFTSGGDATFTNDTSITGDLIVGSPAAPDSLAQAVIFTDAATNKGLVIQGTTSQSASLFELQDNSGNVLSRFDESGGLVLGRSTASSGTIQFNNSTNSNTVTLTTGAVLGTRTITLPDADGTICLNGSDSCGFLALASGTVYTDSTTNNTLAINKTTATGNLLLLQRSGSTVFTIGNNGALQIQATSATALDIRNASGTSYLTVDTSTGTTTIDTLALTNGISGAGLADCDGTYDSLQWDVTSGLFTCRDDTPTTRSFLDTTSDALVDADTTDYWDTAAENNNSHPNITPSATTMSIMGTATIEFTSASTQNRDVIARIERGIGSAPTCGSGTVVGGKLGIFSTNTGLSKSATVTFIDDTATTSNVYYTICSDAGSNNVGGMSATRIRVTLQEVLNSN